MAGKHVYHGGIFNYFNGANINKIVFNGGKGTEDNDDDAWTVEQKEDEKRQPEEVQAEELCHFVHPSVDSQQEWTIHNEIKRLVTRQSLPEICQYLLKMRKDNKILLPPSPSAAYEELIRMGMPRGEGFSESTFRKYYIYK